MAIRIIEGKIGSGKTYYAVNHVFREYFRWCDNSDSWVQKNTDVELRIYTNIKNMKLGFDLDIAIEEAGGLIRFFHPDYQTRFCQGSNVIYIIDEAQGSKYFHRRFCNTEVFEFFQMCRQSFYI